MMSVRSFAAKKPAAHAEKNARDEKGEEARPRQNAQRQRGDEEAERKRNGRFLQKLEIDAGAGAEKHGQPQEPAPLLGVELRREPVPEPRKESARPEGQASPDPAPELSCSQVLPLRKRFPQLRARALPKTHKFHERRLTVDLASCVRQGTLRTTGAEIIGFRMLFL